MNSYQLFINGKQTGLKIVIAETVIQRFLGLMGKKEIPENGMLFKKCNSIHTFFMCFNIDVIFLNSENKVIKIIKNLHPWKITIPILSSNAILEIPSNLPVNPKIELNDFLSFIK